jgi:hypothetical protein
VRIAAITSDLMLFSRIDGAATGAGAELLRVQGPADLPPAASIDLVLVDWTDRTPTWGADLATWRGDRTVRIIAYGPHTDLDAHAAARAAGLAPMWARSKLVSSLPNLVAEAS